LPLRPGLAIGADGDKALLWGLVGRWLGLLLGSCKLSPRKSQPIYWRRHGLSWAVVDDAPLAALALF
jgi:hypothetical protein